MNVFSRHCQHFYCSVAMYTQLVFTPHKYFFSVETESGGRYLIHKGPGFGTSTGGQTVVVDAKHMSDKWQVYVTIIVSNLNN